MLSPAAPAWEGCSSPRSLFSFPPASQTPQATGDPGAATHELATAQLSPRGTSMPGGSGVPPSSPPGFPFIPVPAGPATGLGGSTQGKHRASLRIKRPRGSGEGV